MSEVTRGKKQCPQCGVIVGVRTAKCECGYEFTTKRKLVDNNPPIDAIEDVLVGIKICEKASEQQIPIEQYVKSLKLSWEVLKDIDTLKDLRELKSREEHGTLVNKYGQRQAIKFIQSIKEKMED